MSEKIKIEVELDLPDHLYNSLIIEVANKSNIAPKSVTNDMLSETIEEMLGKFVEYVENEKNTNPNLLLG